MYGEDVPDVPLLATAPVTGPDPTVHVLTVPGTLLVNTIPVNEPLQMVALLALTVGTVLTVGETAALADSQPVLLSCVAT